MPLRANVQNMSANDLAFNQQYKNQGLGMQAQNQAFTQALAKYLAPAQVAGMLKNVAAPTQYVNPAQQGTTGGTDYLTAMGLTNQGNIANANANNAYNNSMMQGLFTLGAGALASPTGTFGGLFSNPGLFGSTTGTGGGFGSLKF